MKEFTITMPFTGIAVRSIEAETIGEALKKFNDETTFPAMVKTSETDAEIEQWENIVEGNVFYGVQNSYKVDVRED